LRQVTNSTKSSDVQLTRNTSMLKTYTLLSSTMIRSNSNSLQNGSTN